MKSIKIAGKKFKLASRMTRLYAFFIDVVLIGIIQVVLELLLPIEALLYGESLWLLKIFFVLFEIFLDLGGLALWIFGLFFIDGFNKGQGIGKKLLSLQVLRLIDGKPCTFKDAFLRRLCGIFQPLDLLFFFGEKQQRLGDMAAQTVVVEFKPELEQTETKIEDPEKVLENVITEMQNRLTEAREKKVLENTIAKIKNFLAKVRGKKVPEDPEKVLENAIAEMKNRLAAALEKVDASIGIEKQFQNAYESAVAQADQWQESAHISLKVGDEDLAREDLKKRNEYQRLANEYKTQWEEQKQIVRSLNDLLEHLQQKITEAQRQKTVVVAKHRNADAETHLQEMLEEIQGSKALETLAEMEQDATEAATLVKAAVEVDAAYQDAKLEREFASYDEEASIDKDLAELKAKLQ